MKNSNLLNRLWTDSHEKQSPQRFARYAAMLIMLLTLGVGQVLGAKQRYIYVGLSNDYNNNKSSTTCFNFWGGTSGGVKTGTWIENITHDYRNYAIYRVQIYDDNNKAQFKGNDSWAVPGDGYSVTLNGTTNNAVFFSSDKDGWWGQFQENYQVTSTASLSASNTSVAIGTNVTLTPSLSTNATYNEIKSTSYSVTTNPGGGSVTSAGVFSATKAGSYTVTATVTYNAKDFSGITKTATATKTITVYSSITLHDNNGGSNNGSATVTLNATSLSSISAPTRTGYNVEGYYTNAACTTQVATSAGELKENTTYTNSSKKWTSTANQTLYTKWTEKTYAITFSHNGHGTIQVGGSTVASGSTANVNHVTTKSLVATPNTGYNFTGWSKSGTNASSVTIEDMTASGSTTTIKSTATNATVTAGFTAKQSTITLDQTGAATAGSVTTKTATFDADMPTITGSGSLPTAPQGYAFMGYYDALEPLGTQYYNSNGTSAHTWDKEDAAVTLYPYFKKAAVTAITFSPAAVVAPNATITATPTLDPTPTGTNKVCWEVQYSNGTPLPSQPKFTPGASNAVSFSAPAASATYRLQATLKTGDNCASGTELSVYSTTFQVAGEHTVTVKYQDSDGRTLAAPTTATAQPLAFSEAITAPTITGYKFDHWTAGDGVTIKDGESNTATTHIKASYAGTLTAVYNKKRLIYFNNTLDWSGVTVYFYSSGYWSDDKGSGAKTGGGYTGKYGAMTQIAGTDIWYYDCEANNVSANYTIVSFTEYSQNGYENFSYKSGTTTPNKVVYRTDYYSTKLPMYVPLKESGESKNGGQAKYFQHGYWMNYPENTGYTLKIYDKVSGSPAPVELKSIPFEFTDDYTMPMELNVDLEAGQTYGFKIWRNDGLNTGAGTYYGNNSTMTENTTNWAMETSKNNCGLQTTVAGNYKFSLSYFAVSSTYHYRVGVTYPVAVNDYRIVYTDGATWSKAAHSASWYHPSRVITKNSSATEVKRDTISFFWSYGSTPAIKYQQCTGLSAGNATWNAGTSIIVSGYSSVLTKAGVYNFIFEQPKSGGSISLVGVEPYTGSYYIRTDCAGSTKWSNYQDHDHQMTYSDYAEANSGYSHYFCHWVLQNTNVKCVIANDYSPCISDTLVEDYGTAIATIIREGYADAGKMTSANANIRFMWDQSTNKVSRAYIGGSTNISDRFLVLEGDAKMFDENGNPLNITGLNPNEANLIDDQNFVYERTIQVNTKARAKLTAKYNTNIQYFKGSEGVFSEGTTIELLGGDASGKHKMRIVYDFKTNRLVTAYVPEGDITEALAINADIMLVREHQEAGQQLVFKGDGALSKVKTVYGVMRFNRWTLNNKEKTGGHSVVGDPKSAYERGLYWISFPFNVNLSDVFGFGTYGTHWIIMEYDGAARATEGYWSDSEGFWKYVMPSQRSTYTLESGKGYVLALDLDLMKDNNTDFWNNNIEQIELFFPSAEEVKNIEATNVTTTVDSHECTIDRRTDKNSPDINKDRTRADSHWNIIGIPSYANYGSALKDGSGNIITWNTEPYTNDLPFLYEWSTVDNSYAVQSGTTYPFKAMHAYMVQYHGDLYWSLASATPPSIVARSTYAEKPESVEMRLELQQNEMKVDQTFVKLSNDENASVNFAFDEDLCKEFNVNKANIYTIVENYLPVAGNTMPMSEQTTVVPVGVRIAADGDYTFAIPDGTEGIGVTLIDNETGIRTSLSALEYTINLSAGDYADRFFLEISPISQISTDVESISNEGLEIRGARKILIDGLLYIVKEGKLFDAQGKRVQ